MSSKFNSNFEQFQIILLFSIKLFCFDFSIINLVLVNFIVLNVMLIAINFLKLRSTILILFSYFLAIQKPETEKFSTYKCGFEHDGLSMDIEELDRIERVEAMAHKIEEERRSLYRSLLRIFVNPDRLKREGITNQIRSGSYCGGSRHLTGINSLEWVV